MHDNDSFATREDAVRDAIHWTWFVLNNAFEREQTLLRDLEQVRWRISSTDEKRALLENEMPGEFDRFTLDRAERGYDIFVRSQAGKGGAT